MEEVGLRPRASRKANPGIDRSVGSESGYGMPTVAANATAAILTSSASALVGGQPSRAGPSPASTGRAAAAGPEAHMAADQLIRTLLLCVCRPGQTSGWLVVRHLSRFMGCEDLCVYVKIWKRDF